MLDIKHERVELSNIIFDCNETSMFQLFQRIMNNPPYVAREELVTKFLAEHLLPCINLKMSCLCIILKSSSLLEFCIIAQVHQDHGHFMCKFYVSMGEIGLHIPKEVLDLLGKASSFELLQFSTSK